MSKIKKGDRRWVLVPAEVKCQWEPVGFRNRRLASLGEFVPPRIAECEVTAVTPYSFNARPVDGGSVIRGINGNRPGTREDAEARLARATEDARHERRRELEWAASYASARISDADKNIAQLEAALNDARTLRQKHVNLKATIEACVDAEGLR